MATSKEEGLTLIELIVAVGIFGLVISMVFGVFGLAITSQRRIIALKNVNDNVRFTIESMAREIRTGRNFSKGADSLSFINTKSESVVYRLNGGVVEKSSNGGTSYSAVTGSDTTIDYLRFNLDGPQPRITITIGATSRIGSQSANLKIQTTVSSRLLQI